MKLSCEQGCGCQNHSNQYDDGIRVVWHDPTEYDALRHGPPYLMWSASEKKRIAKTARNSADFSSGANFVSANEPLECLLAVMQGLAHIHQVHHWQTQGPAFYGDHLLFERIYTESLPLIDSVAEKAVAFGSKINLLAHMDRMRKVVANVSPGGFSLLPDEMANCSLKAEYLFLGCVDSALRMMGSSGSLTPGINNLLGDTADKHERFVYLLLQRASTVTPYNYER